MPLLETGEPPGDFQLLVDAGSQMISNINQTCFSLNPTAGELVFQVICKYHTQTMLNSTSVSVLERPILTTVDLKVDDEGVYLVIAKDQYGFDITSMCDIDIQGNHERIDHSSFRGLSGHIDVNVAFNGTSITKSIDVRGSTDVNTYSYLFVVIPIAALAILIVSFLFFRRRSSRGIGDLIEE